MDFADRLDMMDDDCDIQGFPLDNSDTEDKPCVTCNNAGWETMDKVAACNCCENFEFYTPRKERESNAKSYE